MTGATWALLPGGLCGCGEGFDHFPRGFEWCSADLKELGAQILNHALVIADGAVRSDIECYAKGWVDHQGHTVYDLRVPEVSPAATPEEAQTAVAIAQRAAKYIRLRGAVFPWAMANVGEDENLVRFVEKEKL